MPLQEHWPWKLLRADAIVANDGNADPWNSEEIEPWKILPADAIVANDGNVDTRTPEEIEIGACDASILDEFYQTPLCCIDAAVGEPLRLGVRRDEWNSNDSPWRLLLGELRRSFRLTNMQIERALREIKESLPSIRKRRFAETLMYTAIVSDLWKQHRAFTGEDPFVDNKSSRMAHGLQLAGDRSQKRASRPDNSLALKRAHAAGGVQHLHAELERIHSSGEARVLLANRKDKTREGHQQTEETQSDDDVTQLGNASRLPWWWVGDETSPVSAARLLSASDGRGFYSQGNRIRPGLRKAQVVTGEKNMIPSSYRFHRRFSCFERHPGLCWKRDRRIYEAALSTASNIERWSAKHGGECYARIFDPCRENTVQLVVYITKPRKRRSYCPNTICLARCAERAAYDKKSMELKFMEDPKRECEYDFLTVWQASRELLNLGATSLEIHRAEVNWLPWEIRESQNHKFRLIARWLPDTAVMYPGIWKPTVSAVEAEAQTLLDKALNEFPEKAKTKKRPHAKSGGMRVSVGFPDTPCPDTDPLMFGNDDEHSSLDDDVPGGPCRTASAGEFPRDGI